MPKTPPKILTSRLFYLFLGLFLAITIFVAKAAWNTRVSSGEMLTATQWNDLVAHIEELENRINTLQGTGGTATGSGGGTITHYAIDNGARSIQTALVNSGLITLSGYLQGVSYSNRILNIGTHSACFSAGHQTGSENHDCFVFQNSADGNWWIYSNKMADSTNLACLASCID